MTIPPELDGHLQRLARMPVLMIATDYDGTLAPIVENPSEAHPDREAMVAVCRLAELAHTHVSIISGRSLRDLAGLTGAPDGVRLIGSHGSEFDPDFATKLPAEAVALRERVHADFVRIADTHQGFGIETKPASVAFHYRNAGEAAAEEALDQILKGPATYEGVQVKRGKKVLELAVVATNKGEALRTARQRVGASAVLFLGDDVTDEDAFATLAGPDVGVKVGEGETLAGFRLGDTHAVSRVLARLYELRAAWEGGSEAVAIEDHAMLSDQRTIALVAPGARIVWCCLPRIDSPSLFSELVCGPAAGYFVVRPADEDGGEARVRYDGDTFHLCTEWDGITVTDWLDCSGGRVMQRAGRSDLMREVTGTGRVRIEFSPRVDFGRVPTRMRMHEDGLILEDTFDPIVLRSPGVVWELHEEGSHQTAVAEVDLDPDTPLVLQLRYGTGSLREAIVRPEQRSEQTRQFWSGWAEHLTLPAIATEEVRRSALALKALCHGPSGAIVAAGTTSLPEWIGGVRNWDYRYCWPRDASLAAAALARLGSTGEAMRLLDWLLQIVDGLASKDRLMPIYTVAGGMLHPEAEIGELSGYAGSRPVRVGNAAAHQVQLDVFGPIVELVHRLMGMGAPLSADHWRLVEAMVEAVGLRWREPDHGIWEIRTAKRHHLHSKIMCWQTARLGVEIAEQFAGIERPHWGELRDEIASEILVKGWCEDLKSFASTYESSDVDAGVLHVVLSGLIAPDDPRAASTIETVEHQLRGGAGVWRYRGDDGLPGSEGAFNLCTTWLIRAQAMCGRVEEARELFEAYLGLCGSTGLLPEEYDPESGRGLGNHPQAYSHLGLIEAALCLSELAAPTPGCGAG